MKQRTKKPFIIVILIFVIMALTACSNIQDDTLETSVELTTEATFNLDFSQNKMMETIKVLAAVDNARITGFDGESAAADYVTEQFTQMGLEVSEQRFPVKAYVCDTLELQVNMDEIQSVDEAKALSFSAATPVWGIDAEIIALGKGAEADYEGKEVTGKIVLMQRGGEYFYVKTARAAQMGAIAVLFYDPDSEGAISATLTELSKIPAVSIPRATGQAIEKTLLESNNVSALLTLETTYEDSNSANIKALYKSSDNPEGKRVIIGAHYDGVDTPAANDNASGAAVIMEIARVLTQQGVELPYDVEFVAFGAEEIGLIGSEQYVNNMSRDEKNAVLAMINFDMVGVGDSFDIGTAEGHTAADLVKMTRETLKTMGYTATTSTTDRSDHAPFAYAGIDAVYVQVGPFEAYHTDFDTYDAIQPEMLVKVCELGTKLLIDALPDVLAAQ